MPIDLSFSQLLAVIAQVERYALSGGLEIARPEASARLVFDRGVLLHAEMTRARGRTTKGPSVLDELIGRHQGTLAWVWPGEREEAPKASVTTKDTSIFRRSLKMLVRYGYFDDPQATPVAADFFGVPEEALATATTADRPKPRSKVRKAVAPHTAVAEAAPSIETVIEEEVPDLAIKEKPKEKVSGSRSVIANPQTALGKLVFNKALRLGGNAQDDEADETNDNA